MKTRFITIVACLISCLSVTTVLQAGSIKCWVNRDGIRECGNTVPPEYSQAGHEQYNNQGLKVKEIDRAKSVEEIEKERQAEIAKQDEERKKKEQLDKDREVLALFSKEEDILVAKQARLNTIETTITSIQAYIGSLEKNLGDLNKNLEESKKNNVAADGLNKIERDIQNVNQRIKNSQTTLEGKRKEKEQVSKEYDNYLERYREVKSRGSDKAIQEEAKKKSDKSNDSAPSKADKQ